MISPNSSDHFMLIKCTKSAVSGVSNMSNIFRDFCKHVLGEESMFSPRKQLYNFQIPNSRIQKNIQNKKGLVFMDVSSDDDAPLFGTN